MEEVKTSNMNNFIAKKHELLNKLMYRRGGYYLRTNTVSQIFPACALNVFNIVNKIPIVIAVISTYSTTFILNLVIYKSS
ncbi:hypothetical protein A9264_13110 [Vibrio sp. UCD-FRSSP16_10]|nr:hypothetical protein A9260_13325 [Vibrio sp. UCD-FRSSP16_30]OBT20566.1 hypothetical protein A9264_13110 [Vibrio sp. UCD-FRSSP16_10]